MDGTYEDARAAQIGSSVFPVADPTLVPTTELARQLGVSPSAIVKWMKAGSITPEIVTPGGHPRWDPDRVREQLKAQRKRDE